MKKIIFEAIMVLILIIMSTIVLADDCLLNSNNDILKEESSRNYFNIKKQFYGYQIPIKSKMKRMNRIDYNEQNFQLKERQYFYAKNTHYLIRL
jgi:uncharacterized protein YxeA